MNGEVTRYESSARGRRLQDQLGTVLLVCSIVTLIFTGGYNWRRVDELTTKMEEAHEVYVRKDILEEQFRTLNAQLSALRTQLDDLKATLRETRP